MEMGTAGKEKTARLAISRSIEDCAPSEQQAAGVFTMIKLLHKRETATWYLGFGDTSCNLSTRINHIEGSVSSVNNRYPAECANKRYKKFRIRYRIGVWFLTLFSSFV